MAALLTAVPAQAVQPVAVANQVYVERAVAGSQGRVLEPATSLRRGDRVIYVVSWKAAQASTFTVTNPLPRTVAFERSAGGGEDVSVDGGRSWGKLGALRVRDGRGWRDATPEDVTHVRWQVPR